MSSASGILLVDKPSGISSFAVVDHVRRQLIRSFPELSPPRGRSSRKGGPRPPRFRCGHAGTLDPLATGLLVLLIGKGSRLSPFLMGLDKAYTATLRFGAATDTLDRDGQVTHTAIAPESPAAIADLLPNFSGTIQQVPPLISALKRDGKPLYKRVRDGEDVAEPEAREVTISRLEIQGVHWGLPMNLDRDADTPGILGANGEVHEMDLLVECTSGTYIRSLARDLGESAGSVAHLHRLRRLRVGPYDVRDSVTGVMDWDGVAIAEAMLSLDQALAHWPGLALTDAEAALVRNGHQPEPEWLERLDGPPVAIGKAGRLFRLVDPDGELAAVGSLDPESGAPGLAAVIPADPTG
jgi:tRNA pseudouridine55 synthase